MKRLFALLLGTWAIDFTLNAQEHICVGQRLAENTEYSVFYMISGKNEFYVDVTLHGERAGTVYRKPTAKREDKFSTRTEAADTVKLCFKNRDEWAKAISFQFTQTTKTMELLTDEPFYRLNESIHALSDELDTVYSNVIYYNKRTHVHRELLEETYGRVLLASLFKAVLSIATCAIQVLAVTQLVAQASGV